jgi:hypothetical protein
VTESYKEVKIDFSIVNVMGQSFDFPGYWMQIGNNKISIDIQHLPAGIYYLRAFNPEIGQRIFTPFVKAR